ncbi:alpha/beta hydrolase [Actinoallomurus spadix]|uniref:alpha/beta hydrolase n=1 Tax=Actinoallomurus spadix TaxID=79912 RepID=UPI002092821D|nr:alpha/beta hydrolase [Actinoallomurus spadix]MCO5990463.1 alpha/beta hydrolase [Actinoallomurus spadix]
MRNVLPLGNSQARSAVAVTMLAGIGVLASMMTSCSSNPDANSGKAAAQTTIPVSAASDKNAIAWGACPPLAEGATRDPREKCGTVKVPLDYRHPGGKSISIAVSRIATAKPGKRRGALLLNPGGPALEGLDMPGQMAPTLPASVLDRYDLIGFDPRGVGHSAPISCHLNDPNLANLLPYPAADGSITANVAQARTTARQCASSVGDDLRFFTTPNTARDLDRVRRALGEKKISYWGQSYGTYLGAVYRALFPGNTDRMILEGNVDPNLVWQKQSASWNKGMADRFPDAARVAAAHNDSIGFGTDVPTVTRNYLALADRLDREPAPLPGTNMSLNGLTLRQVTYSLLLHNETLPVLTQVWKASADLADGKPSDQDKAVLAQVASTSPAEPGVPADNQTSMFLALVCGDAAWSHDINKYAADTAADRKAWPLTDGMPKNIWPCAFWQAPNEAPVKVTSRGHRDVLILQNRRDNATPWETGLGLRRTLGSRASFVGVDNGGHYVYHAGSTCADAATVAFLADGRLPARDLHCTAKPLS